MLIDDCARLSQVSQELVDLTKYASDLKKFRERQTRIAELLRSLKPMLTALSAFREGNLISVDFNQKADAFLVEVLATLSEFQKDRGWLLEKFKLNTLKSKVDDLKNELERQLRHAWATYKKNRVPSTNSELLGLLAKIQTFKPTVQKVRTLLAQIDAVDFPRNFDHFQEIDQSIISLATEWNSLKSDEVPAIVLDFLRAAATSHGATVDLLTPEVKAWLYDHSVSRFFSIRISE
jgi:hypothetical protein